MDGRLAKDAPRCRRWPGWVVLALLLALGVVAVRQFPGLMRLPQGAAELLEELYPAPVSFAADAARFLAERLGEEGVVLFIRACGLPEETRERLIAHVRGEGFGQRTIPFVFYLYDLYGAALAVQPEELTDLAYAEAPESEPAAETQDPGAGGLSTLVGRSRRLRAQAAFALRLYDALFLQLKPGWESEPVARNRYLESSYQEIQDLVRTAARSTLLKEDRADGAENEYLEAVEEMLADEERMSELIGFFSDFIRQLSDGWLEAFLRREQRKDRRLAWVREQIAANRYDVVADYARARADRRLVFHLAVDGLQGQLLEGLAQLSSGQREGPAARYVADLVGLHRTPVMDPGRYDSAMPPGLGADIQELADRAPVRPSYLANFKRYCFAPGAGCVAVHVATVDTPSISVRNLPLIQTGHGVAGRWGTGIPNFSYLDRPSGMGWYFWGSDVLYQADIFANREDHIPGGRPRAGQQGARTLFQRLWRYNTVSAMATLDEGALEKISAEVGLAVGEMQRNFIEKVLVLRFRRRSAMERELDTRRRWLAEHRRLSRAWPASAWFGGRDLETFREYAEFVAEHEDEGLPDYLLWYNPWPDHFAHGAGPYSDAIVGFQGEYDRLDFYLGKMVEIYRDSGCFDRTLFGVVSDHGLIYTPRLVSTDEMLFRGMEASGLQVRYKKLTHDEGGLPALHDRRRLRPVRGFDVVVGSTAGGSYILDFFAPAKSGGEGAALPGHPDFHQLREATLRSGQAVDWIAELRQRLAGVMDLALVREQGPGAGASWPAGVESVVRLLTPDRGDARIYRLRSPEGELRYRYEILGETDPLDLAGSLRDFLIPPGGPTAEEVRQALLRCVDAPRGCTDEEWREPLSATLRPDVIYQYSHLYDTERAGTVNVFPVRHVGMNSSVPGRHAGEMFGEKNGTQLYWGAGLRSARLRTARNGSLPVTLYRWLVGEEVFRRPDRETGLSAAGELSFPSLLGEEAFAPLRQALTEP